MMKNSERENLRRDLIRAAIKKSQKAELQESSFQMVDALLKKINEISDSDDSHIFNKVDVLIFELISEMIECNRLQAAARAAVNSLQKYDRVTAEVINNSISHPGPTFKQALTAIAERAGGGATLQ